MQQWLLPSFFVAVGMLPMWTCFRASRTGEINLPAGLRKYGLESDQPVTRTRNASLFAKLRALQLLGAVMCFAVAALMAWAS